MYSQNKIVYFEMVNSELALGSSEIYSFLFKNHHFVVLYIFKLIKLPQKVLITGCLFLASREKIATLINFLE